MRPHRLSLDGVGPRAGFGMQDGDSDQFGYVVMIGKVPTPSLSVARCGFFMLMYSTYASSS